MVTRAKAPIETPDGEAIAAAIVEISLGMKAIAASRLNRKALVVLLQASTRQTRSSIEAVLDGLTDLQKDYLK